LITLGSRRILRDLEISKERQISGAKGAAKRKQNLSKTLANIKQIPEYDNDIDTENDIELKLKGAFDENYLDKEPMKWAHLDFNFELQTFINKVRGSPEDYTTHDRNGLRKAFQYQLRNSKGKSKNGSTKDKSTEHLSSLVEGFKRRHGQDAAKGPV
jgi:hypothetical protein